MKAFIKPFEAPQRSAKIKFNLIFSLCPGLGRQGLSCLQREKRTPPLNLFPLNVIKGTEENSYSLL